MAVPNAQYNGFGFGTGFSTPYYDFAQALRPQTSNTPQNAAAQGIGFQPLSPAPPQAANTNTAQPSPTSISPPQLLNFGAKIGQQATGIGNTITNSINNFGQSIGFGGGNITSNLGVDLASQTSAAFNGIDLAGFGIAPGASTEAAASAADLAGGFTGFGAADTGFTGATLSGTLGAAGLGALGGGILASALGENATGGSIGGALGAGAGYALGGSAAAALGIQLGAFAGPVGALVGGVAGSIFGGMFGGGGTPATSTGVFAGNLNADGSFANVGYGSKNGSTAIAQQINTELSSVFSQASKDLGIQFNPKTSIYAGTNTLYSGDKSKPGFIDINGQRTNFVPGDTSSIQNAAYQALQQAATASGYTNTQTLQQWFATNYQGAASGLPPIPQIPNNPNPTGNQTWAQFMQQYNQSTGAPTPVATNTPGQFTTPNQGNNNATPTN